MVGDVRNASLAGDPAPEIDLPFTQVPRPAMNLTVRAGGDPARLAPAILRAIAAPDPDQPVTAVQTLDEALASGRSQPKTLAILVGLLTACAAALAMVGLYGLIAYWVGQRTSELGVRIALGATRGDVVGLVVRQGVGLTLLSVAAGLASSFAVTQLLAAVTYGVTPTDTAAFSVGPTLFLLLATLASCLPARRAARIAPSEALRTQ